MSGNYSITVSPSDKELIFSFVGYDSQTISIGNQTRIDVTLQETSHLLDEVVAIGYARVKRKDLTAATVSVGGDDLKIAPVTTAAQALTGKAAGVNVVTQSGAPGADINITVRGGGDFHYPECGSYVYCRWFSYGRWSQKCGYQRY